MQPLDLTICIPTYNRCAILEETLQRLYDSPIRFAKVMVSDNASSDETVALLERYRQTHANFDYQVQPKNLGPLANFHSLLSTSDTKYQYLLSDDDLLYHENIKLAVDLLEENPFFSAVYGDYHYEVKEYRPDAGGLVQNEFKFFKLFGYGDSPTIFDADTFLDQLPPNPLIHPVYRTEAYRRFCSFDQYSFGFWRLLPRLLKFGPAIHYPIPFFFHHATDVRVETRVHEPWYYDQMIGDFELMLAEVPPGRLSVEERQRMIAKLQPAHFEYAFKDAIMRLGDPLLSRHYLCRLHGQGAARAELVDLWRSSMLGPALAAQLATLLPPALARPIFLQDTIPGVEKLARGLAAHAEGLDIAVLPLDLLAQMRPSGFLVFKTLEDLDHYRAAAQISHRHCAVFEDQRRLLDIF